MRKSEFIEKVAEKAETTKAAAARVVDAIFDTTSGAISEAVRAGQEVSIPGFGKFKPKTRPARKGRNPQTGAEIQIPERKVVSFSTGKALRENLELKSPAKGGRSGAGKSAGGAAAKKKAGGATGAKQPGKRK